MFSVRLNRRAWLGAGGALCASLAGLPAQAQDPSFPSKTVRVITPFPVGSGPDVALRVVANHLAGKWGQAVIVDNRPGGNGFIAISGLKQASADGHVLVQLDSNHLTTHPHTFSKLPYDPQKDLEPIRPLFRNNFFVAVSAESPFKSIDDIITAARSDPTRISYGSWFNGSPGHLGALRLAQMKGISMMHVPFKDMNQLYMAVANREVDWALGSAASAGALEKAGKLRFLAITGPARSKAYPQVPSVDDRPGTKGYEVAAWTGLFSPKGTPKAVREKISADVLAVLRLPDVVERYSAFGYEIFDAGPDAYAEAIRRETASWADVIRGANLKLD